MEIDGELVSVKQVVAILRMTLKESLPLKEEEMEQVPAHVRVRKENIGEPKFEGRDVVFENAHCSKKKREKKPFLRK